jgi:hypothetical protein
MASLNPNEEEMSLDSFYAGGPKTFQEAFPPYCLKSHWDPSDVSRHILPTGNSAPLMFDPRPAAYICTTYYETSPGDAPLPPEVLADQKPLPIPEGLRPPANFVREEPVPTPPGGAAGRGAPYSGYASAVDTESDVYRLDEPLTRCKEYRYVPPNDMPEDATNVVPGSQPFEEKATFVSGATFVTARAGCREADDEAAWDRSGRLFFNHTKLDRYYPTRKIGPLACGKNTTLAK